MKVSVLAADAGKRLDVYITQASQLNRTSIQKLLKDSKISVNGQPQPARYKVKTGDVVKVEYSKPTIPSIEIPIIYKDSNCLVINKPTGVLSHSKGAFNPEATVATFIEPYVTKLAGDRAGIVHRLDRATSGVMICARNAQAMAFLQKQFSQRKVKKIYYAVVCGRLEPAQAVIDMPIERNPNHPKTFRVSKTGRPAITEYQVEQAGAKYSLVRLSPKTGRTHQLRVHLKQLGHPIVGDTFYDGEPADRLYLHATSLEITIPGGTRKTFEASLPKSFRDIIKR